MINAIMLDLLFKLDEESEEDIELKVMPFFKEGPTILKDGTIFPESPIVPPKSPISPKKGA